MKIRRVAVTVSKRYILWILPETVTLPSLLAQGSLVPCHCHSSTASK